MSKASRNLRRALELQQLTQRNQQNAQSSTGPRTDAGKQTSSSNSLKHGLASRRIIIPGENQSDYDELESSLLATHQPTDDTQKLLVEEMALHFWLAQRAIRFQNEGIAANSGQLPANFGLLLRYQTTNERAFHKALTTFLTLRKQAGTSQTGFVSQQAELDRAKAEINRAKTAVDQMNKTVQLLMNCQTPGRLEELGWIMGTTDKETGEFTPHSKAQAA